MRPQDKARLRERKREIDDRNGRGWQPETVNPVLGGANVHYEVSDRVRAVSCGGLGLVHSMVQSLGLPAAINDTVRVFERHVPYHESDHVLTLAYNVLAGGRSIEDIKYLRSNTSLLDLLGARRLPGPSTAGDFLRRFTQGSVESLMEAINSVRKRVWRLISHGERELARIDVDGTIAPTLGECKAGMDLSYKGLWGYHPLIVTLANTQEVLYCMNRPGNRPSHEEAPVYLEAAAELALDGGFRRVRFRGDTDFALRAYFDGWDDRGFEFVFSMDAHPKLVEIAEDLPKEAWKALKRQEKRPNQGTRRSRPENVKARIVEERGFRCLHLEHEEVAEFQYAPGKSDRTYRGVVVRKTIRVTEGQLRLEDEVRFFFYVTNVPASVLRPHQVVFESNARCHQENIIEQLKNGLEALRMPSDGLVSNWAYLVCASLAWNLKAWMAICMPDGAHGREIRRMEWRRFLRSIMLWPCQVVKSGRRLVLRFLAYSEWAAAIMGVHEFFSKRRFT